MAFFRTFLPNANSKQTEKTVLTYIFVSKLLHVSEKSTTFAVDFNKNMVRINFFPTKNLATNEE